MNLTDILQGANIALTVLQARLVLVLTLVLTFVLFVWAMVLQTQLGSIIAAAWALLVFLPVLYTGGRRHGIEALHRHTGEESRAAGRPDARAA